MKELTPEEIKESIQETFTEKVLPVWTEWAKQLVYKSPYRVGEKS